MSESPDLPRRLEDLFPPGFDSKSRSSSSRGHYSFAPEQLYRILTQDYKPEKHIESTLVNAAWYGKQKKGARHEFILIEVEDSEAGLKNFVVLDRNNADHPSPEGGQSPNSHRGVIGSSHSCRSPALDAFRVSYNGDMKQLLRECQLLNHQYLEKMDFRQSEELYLYQLVTLVNAVSRMSVNYTVAGENCYWFAGIIWECLRTLRPEALYEGPRAIMRGRFAALRRTPGRTDVENACDAYKRDIKIVDSRLKILIQGSESRASSPGPIERSSTCPGDNRERQQASEPRALSMGLDRRNVRDRWSFQWLHVWGGENHSL